MSVQLPTLINAVAAVAGATSAIQTTPQSGQAEDIKNLDLFVNVTAATGGTTPTVVVEVQWSHDGVNFFSVDGTKDVTAGTAVGEKETKEFEVKAPYWQVVTTFTGAPTNMTYKVDARYTS